MTENSFDGSAEAVAQIGHMAGDVHFHAPQRANAHPPRQVPPPTRHYTNNERQLRELTAGLLGGESEQVALAVIRGPLGGGKSETAYQWIAEHAAAFPDGLFYADLSGADGQPGEVSEWLRTFLVAVGYAPAELPGTLQGRCNYFRSWTTGKRVAVVIDGALTAAQVPGLLPGPGRSVVLVTEAGPLEQLSAREKPVFVDLDPLSPETACVLVRRILGEHDPRPDAESDELDALVALCEGQGLALCVAAAELARRPARPISRLVQDLSREGRRLKVLSPKRASLSMTATLNTVAGRLDESTQQAYSVFGWHPGAGDVGLPAFASALQADEDDVRDRLDNLVDARLVQETAPDRFFASGFVRDHARERETGHELQKQFVRYYALRAIPAGNAVMPQRGWLERIWRGLALESTVDDPEAWLEAERPALRAVAGLLHADGDPELMPLAVALWPFHERAKHLDDMDEVNRLAAELAEAQGHGLVHGLALVQRGFAFRHRGEHDKAAEQFAAAEGLAREAGTPDLEATAVESLGLARREQGDRSAACGLLRGNLDMATKIGDPRRTALAKMHLGSVAEPDEAIALLDAAIEGFRALPKPDVHNEHKSLLWRGTRFVELGQRQRAETDLTAALRQMTSENRRFEIAQAQHALGRCALATGDETAAQDHFRQAASIYQAWGFLDQAEQVRLELGR